MERIIYQLNILFLIILLSCFSTFSQSIQSYDLEQAKKQLESLQKQIWQIEKDGEDKKELERERLNKRATTKDEFETTKQFEERKTKTFDSISAVLDEISKETERKRDLTLQKINLIQRTEFSISITISLGTYDADKQMFPLILDNGSYEFLFVPLSDAKVFKENFSESEMDMPIGLILDEQNRAREYIIRASVKFRGKIYKTVSNSLSLEKVMRLAFGNYSEATKSSNWTTILKHAAIYDSDDWETNVLYKVKAIPIGFKAYQQAGHEKVIFFMKTKVHFGRGEDCRICGQVFSFVIFVKNANGWKLETVVKNAGEHGGWGDLPAPSFVKIGADKYALSFGAGGMYQGYIIFGEYYLELKDGYLQEIFQISTQKDNSSPVGNASKDFEVSNSKVEFIKGRNQDYFDIKVITTGKKAAKVGKRYVPKAFSKIEIYSYINGKYQLVK